MRGLTEEVRENRLEILTSDYEHFKSTSGEGISEVFERYNKSTTSWTFMKNSSTQKEINRKFLLTLPTHMEHRITAIRESRDMNEVSLERLYGVLKTYETWTDTSEGRWLHELEGKSCKCIHSSSGWSLLRRWKRRLFNLLVLIRKPLMLSMVLYHPINLMVIFYSLEELEQLEDESMALIVKRFGKFRFRRNPNFKFKSNVNADFRRGGLRPQIAQEKATRLGWLTEVRFFASAVMRWGTLLLNARSQGNSRILLMMWV